MAENGNGNGRRLNMGDLLHFLEIGVLLISVGMSYQRFQETEKIVGLHGEVLNRIERYLSSKDKNYWRDSVANDGK